MGNGTEKVGKIFSLNLTDGGVCAYTKICKFVSCWGCPNVEKICMKACEESSTPFKFDICAYRLLSKIRVVLSESKSGRSLLIDNNFCSIDFGPILTSYPGIRIKFCIQPCTICWAFVEVFLVSQPPKVDARSSK